MNYLVRWWHNYTSSKALYKPNLEDCVKYSMGGWKIELMYSRRSFSAIRASYSDEGECERPPDGQVT